MRRAAVAAVGLLLLGVAAPAGAATDYESGLWWYDEAGLAEAHAEVTGEGVTIALLDTPVNPDAPTLVGANVRAGGVDECVTGEPVPVLDDGPGSLHGTGVATMLVGNGQSVNGNPGISGVAPEVKLLVYGAVHNVEGMPDCVSDIDYTVGLIRDAVAQGADMIVLTSGLVVAGETATALLQAINAGVIVVAANPNSGMVTSDPWLQIEPASFNGVVSVESYGPGRERDDPVVAPWVTVVSPGDHMLTYGQDEKGWYPGITGGNSLATPFTAGALALAMQKWPEASSNQILQSLIHTASHADPDPVRTDEEGYGFIDVPALLANDPSQYPDENPLIRADGVPAPEQFEAGVYADEALEYPIDPPIGEVPSSDAGADGDDAASGGSSDEPFPTGLALGLAGGGVALVGVIVLVVVLVTRRKRQRPEAPQVYDGQQPLPGQYPQSAYGQQAHYSSQQGQDG